VSGVHEVNGWLGPLGTGGTSANFVGDPAGREREGYGARSYARLAALEQQWDPANLFHFNQNVAPAV
jgi:hypothetical protein